MARKQARADALLGLRHYLPFFKCQTMVFAAARLAARRFRRDHRLARRLSGAAPAEKWRNVTIFRYLARFRGRFDGNTMTELDRRFLHILLHHGGACDARLTAVLRDGSERRARDFLLDMLELGMLRRVYIDGMRDPARFFQITAKAARWLGHTGANAARQGQDAGWLLRGLTRFWFRGHYQVPDGAHMLHGQGEIADAFEARKLRLSGTGPGRDRFIETVVSREDGGLEAWSFPAPGRPLQPHAEAVILRFADSLPSVKLGWVIDVNRAGELARIVSTIAGRNIPFRPLQAPTPAEENGREALLEAQKQARTALEKAQIQREIDALAAYQQTDAAPENPKDDPLAAAFLPGIIHDLF